MADKCTRVSPSDCAGGKGWHKCHHMGDMAAPNHDELVMVRCPPSRHDPTKMPRDATEWLGGCHIARQGAPPMCKFMGTMGNHSMLMELAWAQTVASGSDGEQSSFEPSGAFRNEWGATASRSVRNARWARVMSGLSVHGRSCACTPALVHPPTLLATERVVRLAKSAMSQIKKKYCHCNNAACVTKLRLNARKTTHMLGKQ